MTFDKFINLFTEKNEQWEKLNEGMEIKRDRDMLIGKIGFKPSNSPLFIKDFDQDFVPFGSMPLTDEPKSENEELKDDEDEELPQLNIP